MPSLEFCGISAKQAVPSRKQEEDEAPPHALQAQHGRAGSALVRASAPLLEQQKRAAGRTQEPHNQMK
jgi:hypothetical protein